MNTTYYILLGWLLFVTLVYGYMFYDIYAAQINLREKWRLIYEAFTEEE